MILSSNFRTFCRFGTHILNAELSVKFTNNSHSRLQQFRFIQVMSIIDDKYVLLRTFKEIFRTVSKYVLTISQSQSDRIYSNDR